MTALIETYKQFTFEAAHQLPPYSGLHGHSFKVSVHISGSPDAKFGWAANLYELERHVEALRLQLDHSYLNDIDGLEDPSLENIAAWIWARLRPDIEGMTHVTLSRGIDGQAEGCVYRA
ncbi:6-pyruvoyl trahydropterin synthase family protein [Paroceanicella profunda]|uniref:6-pyruvoyl trahydropterin synthase family protein n=1 Tax=Paroceanicella profunda TaxID=2579971 RepID=UPI001EF00179|nr:6-carboxytetrahydropterin synthase [Paroceanicella profunda]